MHAGGTKIHKWVDEKGVTHYGDKMPAKDVHRDNSVLNNQGVVIRRNQVTNINNNEMDANLLEQKRRDRALRASYTNAEEIDLARNRSLEMDQASIHALEQRKASAIKRLENVQKSIDSFVQKEKTVPDDLNKDAQDIKAEIARIDDQISHRKSSMEATNNRFNEDKQRFMEIKAEQQY